jgi:hypothetical protein
MDEAKQNKNGVSTLSIKSNSKYYPARIAALLKYPHKSFSTKGIPKRKKLAASNGAAQTTKSMLSLEI